jgi:hypothetical protein
MLKSTSKILIPEETNGKSISPKSDSDDAHDRRLHELIDRKFLKILTEEEAEELAELLIWRDGQKSLFYQKLAQKSQ